MPPDDDTAGLEKPAKPTLFKLVGGQSGLPKQLIPVLCKGQTHENSSASHLPRSKSISKTPLDQNHSTIAFRQKTRGIVHTSR